MEESTPETSSKFLLFAAFSLHIIWLISYVWKRRNLYIKSWNIPGPLALPFIGITYKFLWRNTPEDIYHIFEEVHAKHKLVTKMWFGPKLLYLITEPKHVKNILTSPKAFAKDFDFYKLLDFGDSLLSSPVPMWKKHRKIIAPTFSQKNLDSFVEDFVQGGEEMNEDLEKNVGKELDIMPMIAKCNLGVLLRTGLGLDKDVRKQAEDFAEVIDRVMELAFINEFSVRRHIPILSDWIPKNEEMVMLKKRWDDFLHKVFQENLQNGAGRRLSLEPQFDDGGKRITILGSVMDTKLLTMEEIKDHYRGLIFAGTDTTAGALSFTLTLLGIYPDVQQKVYEEMMDILGPDRSPETNDLRLMKYTEQVIKESMRIFPVAPFFLRAITEDLDLGECVLPSGSSVLFLSLHLHRNPDVWEDPLRFDPERFSPENVGKIPQGAYVAFSLGPRNCLGMRYAMMSMKAFLAPVVRNFKFRSDYKSAAEVEVKPCITLKFKAGTKLYAEKRNL